MALGFGFNKQKILASAEKAVQQGKLQNAIADYEKIVKEDPKDLTVLNTIGDLHARIGNNDKASFYFKKVGDFYASDGFTVKAIAVYRKIKNLNPSATECIQKLAELYTQQGLYNDARAHYVQLADYYMKEGNLEESAKVFQKILELDPENTAMQTKLADLYIKLNRKDDARNIFLNAAQALYLKGALDAADEALRRVISLDPTNLDALLLRGKIASDSGDSASAVLYLQKIPDLDARPDAMRALMAAHLQTGKLDEAEGLARKLLTNHNDPSGLSSYAESLMAEGSIETALKVYDQYYDKLLAVNPASTVQALLGAMPKLADNVPALEMLRGIFVKAGEHNRINEVSEALAQACVHNGEFPKAAEIYKELADLEPENPLHMQNFRQLQSRLGQDPTVREISKEAGAQALMVDELEHHAPALQQSYPDPIREAIKAAITEAELFESYNMSAKAVGPLEGVLPQAPDDVQINQRLASLYARAGRLQDAIARCHVLQKVYKEAGFDDQAKQYVDMAEKYAERVKEAAQAKAVEFDASFMPGGEIHMPPAERPAAPPPASAADMPAFNMEAEVAPPTPAAAAQEFSIDVMPPEPQGLTQDVLEQAAAQAAATPPSPAAHEIDLSDWEQMTRLEEPAAPAAPAFKLEDAVEEAKFYIAQALWKEAGDTIAKIEASAPQAGEGERLRKLLESAQAQAAPAASPAEAAGTVAEFTFDVGTPTPPPMQAPSISAPPAQVGAAAPAPAAKPAAPPTPPAPAPPQPVAKAATPPAPAKPVPEKKKDALADFVLDLDESLGEDFAIGAKPKAAPAAATKPTPPPPPPAPPKPGPAVAKPAAPPPPPPPAPIPAPSPAMVSEGFAHPEASAALSDMFAEFKEDVEETADQSEDPDTHYNLGVAFKEMGLLDEAIGELQKVCHAIDKGHPFSQVMQAYTWLAHCFLEKGVPEASVKWYEKALHVPAIDDESRMAVYYELGSAYEAAGDKKLALKNFNEVYSNNIDYRDVAERIKALRA